MGAFVWNPDDFSGGSGTGNVSGPGSSTDNSLVRWNGTNGRNIQNSGVLLDDSDNLSGVDTLSCAAIITDETFLNIVGDTVSGSGGEIRLYSSAHPTDANDVEIYSNNTRIFRYNASAPLLQLGDASDLGVYIRPSFLQLNNAATSGANAGILNGVLDGVTYFGGGTAQTNSANIQLFGSSHSTKASDFEIRAGTTDIINYDHSDTELTLGASGVNVVVGNSGSTETHTINATGLNVNAPAASSAAFEVDLAAGAGGFGAARISASTTQDNNAVGKLEIYGYRADTQNNTTQVEFFYGNRDSSPRQLAEIVGRNTSATVGSSGGILALRTSNTSGTISDGITVDENQAVTVGASGGSQTHRINGGTATSATAGANGDVPAQVVGYLVINVNGTDRKVPYYAT